MDNFKQELGLKPALRNTILGKLFERQALFQFSEGQKYCRLYEMKDAFDGRRIC
jgi:hypothetical protein